MPLKGIVVQRVLYAADPTVRAIHDVDVLVERRHFSTATDLLRQAGFTHRFTSKSAGAVALTSPDGMDLDLHFRLFGPGRYRMSTEAIFARSGLNSEMFGVPIQLMDIYDLYAHMIGKLVSDRCRADDTVRLSEVARLPVALKLDADWAASHLVRCGLRRAAPYALELIAPYDSAGFAARVREKLPPDLIGELVVTGFSAINRRVAPGSPVEVISAHALNESLPRALYAIGAAALARVRHWSRDEA